MRYIKTSRAQVGDKVGKDVFSPSRGSLIRKNAILSESIINSLIRLGVDYLYIDDELTANIDIEEVIPLELKIAATNAIKNINVEKTIDNARVMVDKILSASNLSVDIYNNNESDVFIHSLTVMELSIAIAKAAGYRTDVMPDLAVAALLHDIGKLCVDKEVLKKYSLSKLFDDANLNFSIDDYNDKMHSIYGYNLLANNTYAKAVVKQSVLMHHENYDGTGILKAQPEKVHDFARIIRVADVFADIVTKENNEYNIKTTSEALEFMAFNKGIMFDPRIVEAFLTKVPIYPEGITVILSDNTKAIVAKNNKQFPARPMLITEDKRVIDMTDRDNLTISIISVDNGNDVVEKLRDENSNSEAPRTR